MRIFRIDSLEFLAHFKVVAQETRRRRLETRLGREHSLFGSAYDFLQKLGPLGQLVAKAERRLYLAIVLARVAKRMQEIRVTHEPKVVAVIGAVQAQAQTWPAHLNDRANAGGRGVARVERFELVAHFEFVDGRRGVLTKARGLGRLRSRLVQVLGPAKVLFFFKNVISD